MYARSDIQFISIGEAHGGCGQSHVRAEGERQFAVTCGPCENFLRGDTQMWADSADAVPATFDEERQRENLLRNRELNQASILDQAAGFLAMLAGPRDLLAGVSPALAGPANPCRKCAAAVTPGASFCGSCGSPQLRQVESGVA